MPWRINTGTGRGGIHSGVPFALDAALKEVDKSVNAPTYHNDNNYYYGVHIQATVVTFYLFYFI